VPGADLARCRVIHNFIQYPLLASHVAPARQVRAGQVLLVGRIDTGKGFREFLAAARGRLPPAASIVVIGDGPERAALEREYAGARVRFLGWKPYPEVIARSARSHVCVVPSVWEEPCGTTVLEALALGKPCIALARGGTPELAAYQLYDGQLQLAGSMEQLVALLCAGLAGAPVTVPLPATFGLDVFQAIPNILEFYAE
jgi:glycosyltransferase involved in cell wall biosynthesis